MIDDIKETISDIRFENSKEGKFLNCAKKIQKTALLELRNNNKYQNIRLNRYKGKFKFKITGTLGNNESIEEIKSVFDKYSFEYNIEYDIDN